jgi:hypothetical protein
VSLILLLQEPATFPTGVISTVNRFTDFILQYLVALGAVGALSMALTEAGKKLLDSRTKFLALRWTRWAERTRFDETLLSGPATAAHGGAPLPHPTRLDAMSQLLQLCTGVPSDEATAIAQGLFDSHGKLPMWHAFYPAPGHALFALDLGRMMGSIQEAADIALSSPRQHPSLYLLMTTGANPEDITRWYVEGESSLAELTDATPTAEQRQRVKDHADRYARLRQIVKRKLDGFQLYTGDRWGSWNQFSANLIGIGVMFLVLLSMRLNATGPTLGFPAIIVFSLLGGVLSPVAKELVAALKRVRYG